MASSTKPKSVTVEVSVSSVDSKRTSSDISGSVFLVGADGGMLRLPIPSKSPYDPLAWSVQKRFLAFASILLLNTVGLVAIQAPSMLFGAFTTDPTLVHDGLLGIPSLITAPTFLVGVGTFIWIPLSLAIGRRPVLLLCTALSLLGTLLAASAQNFYTLFIAICIQGLAAGSSFSLMLCIIIDMTFIHQRPQAIAMFWGLGGCITLILVSLIPQITQSDSEWRIFYRTWSIPALISLIMNFLFFPETHFFRPPVAFDGRVLVQNGAEKVCIYSNWDEVPGGHHVYLNNNRQALYTETGRIYYMGDEQPLPEPKFQLVERLKFWTRGPGTWKDMRACYPQMVLCILNPLVFWVTVLNAINFAGMMSIGESFPVVLRSEPHHFRSRYIALINLAAAMGGLLAWPGSGILISNISRKLTRQNGGVRHAECYLPAFVLPVAAGVASLLLFGFAAQYQWHWMCIYIAYALNSFSSLALGAANTLWVTEAFPQWAAAALVVVGGLSYIISFLMSFVLPLWIKSQGYVWTNVEIAMLMIVAGAVGVPVAFWGRNIRQYLNGRWGAYEAGALRPQ